MRLLLLCVFIPGACLTLFGQTAAQDLKKVLDPLIHAENLYFENQYLYFEQGADSPSDSEDGVFQRSGKNEFVKMGSMEVLVVDKLMIAVDHDEGLVSAVYEAEKANLNTFLDTEKLEGMLENRLAKITYTTSSEGLMAISLTDPSNPEEKLVVQYDPFTWVIREVCITTADPFDNPWESQPKQVTVKIRYTNVDTKPKKFAYNTRDYVRKSGDKFIASGKCTGYELR